MHSFAKEFKRKNWVWNSSKLCRKRQKSRRPNGKLVWRLMEKIQSTLRIEPGTAASISEHPTSTHPQPESFGLITYLKQQPISIALLSLPHHIISSPGWQCGQLRKILPNSVLPLRLSKSFGALTSLWTSLAQTAMRPSLFQNVRSLLWFSFRFN